MELPVKVGLVGWSQIVLCGAVLVVACTVEEPTGPPGKPSNVVRGRVDGCVPEVIQSSSPQADTILVTMNGSGEEYCWPNLVPWGIDMMDPVGVDTPQGNNGFLLMSEYNVNTPPAPEGSGAPARAARMLSLSPPQAIIEFDPPVSSVQFYYSRLLGERGYWNGIFYANVDSMSVWAEHRIPGTVSYDFFISKTLHSNVPSTSPPWSVWTPVTMTAPGDQIQWLSFNGGLAIDNLKIVRTPLHCTPATVQRGQQVSCDVVLPPGWNVTGWDFAPDNGATVGPVHETTNSKQWKGVALVTGDVTVHTASATQTRDYKARFVVVNRPSPWTTKWTYVQGTYNTFLTAVDAEPSNVGPGATLGANCDSAQGCVITFRLQPDPNVYWPGEPQSGAVLDSAASGPNKGYWYVKSATWKMSRIGNANPAIRIESTRTHPSLPTTKKCKQSTALRNFYRYDAECQQLNMADFVAGVLAHEGMGRNGGRGHEGLAQAEARKPENDPYAVHYAIVVADSATLATQVKATAMDITQRLDYRSDDNPSSEPGFPPPGGNWGPGVWWRWPSTGGQWTGDSLTVGF
jgi:hypothetical protein